MLEMTERGESVLIWGGSHFQERGVHSSQGVHEKGGSRKGGFTKRGVHMVHVNPPGYGPAHDSP